VLNERDQTKLNGEIDLIPGLEIKMPIISNRSTDNKISIKVQHKYCKDNLIP
jgi:hypothetical protein